MCWLEASFIFRDCSCDGLYIKIDALKKVGRHVIARDDSSPILQHTQRHFPDRVKLGS